MSFINTSKVEEDFDVRFVDYVGNRFIFHGAQHISRYEWISQYAKGKDVLDAGCGSGYGVSLLSKVAKFVLGVDLSENAISYAKARYARPNDQFLVADLTSFSFGRKFDLIVSFEVLEHIHDVDGYLKALTSLLKDDGMLVIGTPNISFKTDHHIAANPFHVKEYSGFELKGLLAKYFKKVEIFGQDIIDPKKKACYIEEVAGEASGGAGSFKKLVPFWLKALIKQMRLAVYFILKPNKIIFVSDMGFSKDNVLDAFGLLAVCGPKII